MRFDFWTFSFQVINFVVLLFILKGLLYKPVKEILEKRRELSRKTLEDAEMVKGDALRMKEAQEKEMKSLQHAKAELIEKTMEEAEEKKRELLLDAQKNASAMIEKERALFAVEKKRAEEEIGNTAASTAATFASSLLKDISCKELHKSIWQNLYGKADEIAKGISDSFSFHRPSVPSPGATELAVRTAWPIGETELEKFMDTLQRMVPGIRLSAVEIADKDLIAGVSIKAGGKVYDFSLAGQIEAFASNLRSGREKIKISIGPSQVEISDGH